MLCCICAGASYQLVYAAWLVAQCLRDLGSPNQLRLLVFPWGHPPPQLLPTFPQFNHRGQLLSISWMLVSASDSFSCCWAFQRVAILGSCLPAHHSISNSASHRPPLALDPTLGLSWTSFLSCSSSFLSLQFFQTGTILGQSFCFIWYLLMSRACHRCDAVLWIQSCQRSSTPGCPRRCLLPLLLKFWTLMLSSSSLKKTSGLKT